jgi:hypothetical protein
MSASFIFILSNSLEKFFKVGMGKREQYLLVGYLGTYT